MKDFSWKIFAIKTIIFSIWGLSTLPFLSIIVQYIDSITGFSSGNGYHTNHMDYIFESPLVYGSYSLYQYHSGNRSLDILFL